MRVEPKVRDKIFSWAGIFVGAGVWFSAQQLGSNLAFAACPSSSPLFNLLLGIVALLLIAGGGLLSLRIWRTREDGARPFIALVGMGASAFFSFAILLQTLAGLIIPRCFA
jgi:hypothetical protein